MNYTQSNNNHKIPNTKNDPSPKINNHATNNIPLMSKNNVHLNPDVLQQIQALAGSSNDVKNAVKDIQPNPPIVQHKNPFRAKTGLLFRDILGRTDNSRNCSSCGTNK